MNIIVLKVLILGGTTFLGPHLIQELVERGHEVTIFNRGNHSCPFPEDVELVIGDREGHFEGLKGRTFDAIIDTSGTAPRIVELSSQFLKGAAPHYTFISTINVYEDFTDFSIDESYPVANLKEETEDTYGAFKARSEQIVENYFPRQTLIIRPGLIVGPLDPTGRFSYWPKRIAQGGDVLAPGDPSAPIQYIDVRDLSKWIVKMMEEGATGTYNATGPATPLTFENLLKECQAHSSKKSSITWVDEAFLLKNQVQDWSELPLWLSSERGMQGFLKVSNKKAVAAGLTFRPLSKTIADTLAFEALQKEKPEVGMTREREEELLELWKNIKNQ